MPRNKEEGMGKLDNRTALVTGGGSGIGLAIAEAFAKEGAKVLLVGRRESVLQEVCEKSENFCYVAADITKTEDVTKVADYVRDNFDGKLNILVNNAGWCPVQPLKAMTITVKNGKTTYKVSNLNRFPGRIRVFTDKEYYLPIPWSDIKYQGIEQNPDWSEV